MQAALCLSPGGERWPCDKHTGLEIRREKYYSQLCDKTIIECFFVKDSSLQFTLWQCCRNAKTSTLERSIHFTEELLLNREIVVQDGSEGEH